MIISTQLIWLENRTSIKIEGKGNSIKIFSLKIKNLNVASVFNKRIHGIEKITQNGGHLTIEKYGLSDWAMIVPRIFYILDNIAPDGSIADPTEEQLQIYRDVYTRTYSCST